MATVAEEVEISEETKVEEPTKLVTPAADGVDAAKVDGAGATAIDPPADGVPQEDAQVSAPVSTPTNDHPGDVVIPDPPEEEEEPIDEDIERILLHHAEIADLRQKAREAELSLNEAKEIVKGRQKRLDAAQELLNQRIDEGPNPHPLLSGKPAPAPAKPQTVNAPVGEAAPPPPPPEPKPDDSWRAMPMSELEKHGLKESIINKLDEHDIRTLGTLTDRMNAKGTFWTEGIKGFGPAKTDAVADAFEAFWKGNPQYCRNPRTITISDEDAQKIIDAPDGGVVAMPEAPTGVAEGAAIAVAALAAAEATEPPGDVIEPCPENDPNCAADYVGGHDVCGTGLPPNGIVDPPVDPRFVGKSDDYKRGYVDYENGVARKDNPHSRGSTNWHDWIDGFNKAMEDAIDADTKNKKAKAGA